MDGAARVAPAPKPMLMAMQLAKKQAAESNRSSSIKHMASFDPLASRPTTWIGRILHKVKSRVSRGRTSDQQGSRRTLLPTYRISVSASVTFWFSFAI
jgi:hypothetical protein